MVKALSFMKVCQGFFLQGRGIPKIKGLEGALPNEACQILLMCAITRFVIETVKLYMKS
jgi:hypothetical protein